MKSKKLLVVTSIDGEEFFGVCNSRLSEKDKSFPNYNLYDLLRLFLFLLRLSF